MLRLAGTLGCEYDWEGVIWLLGLAMILVLVLAEPGVIEQVMMFSS